MLRLKIADRKIVAVGQQRSVLQVAKEDEMVIFHPNRHKVLCTMN